MPFKEIPHYNFGGGIYRVTSNIDPDFPKDALHDAINIVYDGDSDQPQTMLGSTRLGATDMGGTVSGLFDYNNGTKRVATSEDGKIYEYGSDWAAASGARATGNSTTAGVRWSGEMFYGATTTKNLLVLANGTDAPVRYDDVNGAVSLGGSPPATGNYPVAWQGRLWLFDGTTAYYSAPDNCEDWSTAGGGGSVAVFRGHDGDITGAVAFAESLFIFKRSTVYRIAPLESFSSSLHIRNVSGAKGCVSHQSISQGGPERDDYLIWQSEHGFEAITPSSASTGFRPVNIARWVQPIVDTKNQQSMDVAWGLFNQARSEYYGYFPSGTKTVPSLGMICNLAKPGKVRWTRHNRTNLTCGMVYNDSNLDYVQYVGDTNGRVYQMHVANTYDWAGSPVLSRIETPFYVQGHPNRMKLYAHSFTSVDKRTDDVLVKQVLLRQGLPTAASNTTTYSPTGAQGWGTGTWGVEPWGGSGQAGERIRPPSVRRGAGMKHIIESNGWFRLKGIVVSSKLLSTKIAA